MVLGHLDFDQSRLETKEVAAGPDQRGGLSRVDLLQSKYWSFHSALTMLSRHRGGEILGDLQGDRHCLLAVVCVPGPVDGSETH